MTRSEKAVALFESGCNCAQAVFAAFADLVGMDEATALRLSSSFGGGIGSYLEFSFGQALGAFCGDAG